MTERVAEGDAVPLPPNVTQIEPGDPRYCPLSMAHEVHEPHRYEYEYDRPEHLGGHTKGYYFCDGSPW